jgi:uncharacterized protein
MLTLIENTAHYVRQALEGAEAGHDWFHVERVWKLARRIAATEPAALLHDIADPKFHDGDEALGPERARAFLEQQQLAAGSCDHVVSIIRNISFKGGKEPDERYSLELGIVRDADRLDAIGAIGIARAFHYGGFKNRALYDPAVAPDLQMDKEAYRKSTAPTLNHFYEKLLLLKDRMHTREGRSLAEQRHAFLETYLQRFLAEWEGEC